MATECKTQAISPPNFVSTIPTLTEPIRREGCKWQPCVADGGVVVAEPQGKLVYISPLELLSSTEGPSTVRTGEQPVLLGRQDAWGVTDEGLALAENSPGPCPPYWIFLRSNSEIWM
jgi:hypothetical protein